MTSKTFRVEENKMHLLLDFEVIWLSYWYLVNLAFLNFFLQSALFLILDKSE